MTVIREGRQHSHAEPGLLPGHCWILNIYCSYLIKNCGNSHRLACMACMASPISQTLGCPLGGSTFLSDVVRQSGEGLMLARSGATYMSAVPSSLAAVNSSCLLETCQTRK